MNPLVVLGGLGAIVALAARAGKSGIPAQNENLTFVTGKSGAQYAILLGEPTNEGQRMTVMNTDMVPLFTYNQTHGGPRQFVESHGAEQGELAKALADFQPMVTS